MIWRDDKPVRAGTVCLCVCPSGSDSLWNKLSLSCSLFLRPPCPPSFRPSISLCFEKWFGEFFAPLYKKLLGFLSHLHFISLSRKASLSLPLAGLLPVGSVSALKCLLTSPLSSFVSTPSIHPSIPSSLHRASLCQYSLVAVFWQGCEMRLCRVVSDTWPDSAGFSPAHFHSFVKPIGWLAACTHNNIQCLAARTWGLWVVVVLQKMTYRQHFAFMEQFYHDLWSNSKQPVIKKKKIILILIIIIIITKGRNQRCNMKGRWMVLNKWRLLCSFR